MNFDDYGYVGRFRDGVACVEKNGEWWTIDKKGEKVA